MNVLGIFIQNVEYYIAYRVFTAPKVENHVKFKLASKFTSIASWMAVIKVDRIETCICYLGPFIKLMFYNYVMTTCCTLDIFWGLDTQHLTKQSKVPGLMGLNSSAGSPIINNCVIEIYSMLHGALCYEKVHIREGV